MDSITPHLKMCKKCTKEFPANTEFFNRASNAKDGLFSWCKTCQCAYMKERRNDPKALEREKAYAKAYNARPDIKERQRIYDSQPARREKREAAKRNYRQTPEGKKHESLYQKEYHSNPEIQDRYQANRKVYNARPDIKEKHQAYQKTYGPDYRRNNQERLSAQKKARYQQPEVRERYRLMRQAYYQHPEVRILLRERNNRRRALKLAAPGTYTMQDMREQYKRQKGKCYWCQQKVKWEEHHDDHIVPLTRGGSNWPDNMCISCPTCNLKKKDKLPHEFPEGNRLL